MLKQLSTFVLEVLPCVLTAVIAAALIPGFVYSQIHGTNAVAMPSPSSEKVVAMSRQSRDEFTSYQFDKRLNAPQSTLPHR
jgi:hypothetical protein